MSSAVSTKVVPDFETIHVSTKEIICDGGEAGHPRVFLHIEEGANQVVCPYCSRLFVYQAA